MATRKVTCTRFEEEDDDMVKYITVLVITMHSIMILRILVSHSRINVHIQDN